MRHLIPLIGCVLLLGGCADSSQPAVAADADCDYESYQSARANFTTDLTRHLPSPQEHDVGELPEGATRVEYESAGRTLHGYLWFPEDDGAEPVPALMQCHSGWAFGATDLRECSVFRDAGYAVFCPTYRGENGNPGDFEFCFGEVDDAAAAVRWLGSQPRIDSSRIYVFGHAEGGAISALLSLQADLPIRAGGGFGGLYSDSIFEHRREIVPFDTEHGRNREKCLRLLLGNQRFMLRDHYAYMATTDAYGYINRLAAQEQADPGRTLEVIRVDGQLLGELESTMAEFLELIEGLE